MEYVIFQITFLLLYVVYVMLQLFLYCYMGEKLAAEVLLIKGKLINRRFRWWEIIKIRNFSEYGNS